jgi:hypothetical protein
MLAHEAVCDATRLAAGEGVRERRWRAAAQRLAVRGRGGSLGREHERRAELCSGRARRQHGGDSPPGRDTSRRDQRQLRHRAHQLEQRQQADVAGRGRVGAPAVAPGLDALDDQGVRSAAGRQRGLLRRRDRDPYGGAGLLERTQLAVVGTPERERHDGHALLARQRELLVPAVVVVARLAE